VLMGEKTQRGRTNIVERSWGRGGGDDRNVY
jgi:hypothetical protein